ncbi:Cystathionine beta-lyase PatB [Desulfitobacterium hafniense]|uniref:cysteine-S-conjugate beta-lyase n=1 Tax=Desulfitobacterium hafniense TaxID=49338 RepID=A0A098B5N5_DESHA|nr:MalY/PatB family protein [Desulfitobacterium hafniense]CDX03171.1 Cystathionine beta-lyase PatB [Desulfitobacterium hafniense]
MSYNFDEYIDRYGTESTKWDAFENRFPGLDAKGCIPMWVADTDFRAPQEVIDAIVAKAEFGIFGYPKGKGESFDQAVTGWICQRHGWQLDPEWIVPTTGVVPAITHAVQAFTQEGDGVLIQPPVYYPFKNTIQKNKRRVIENPLLLDEETEHYEIDFVDFEHKLSDPKTKLFILCNPHNPVGRVWSEEDLTKIGELCLKHQVLVFADEIHSDLILKGSRHIPLGMLDERFNQHVITAYSASKTFNLAGLQTSVVILPERGIRQKYLEQLEINQARDINIFGTIALEAAYTHGADYLKAFLEHVESNLDYALDFTEKHLQGVRIIKPQGTYLVWFDFRGTGLTADQIDALIIEKAKVAVDLGRWFGEEGAGFLRFNFACHRSTLVKALEQIKEALTVL